MKELSDHIWHQKIQSITEEYCEGELTPMNVFQAGTLTGRTWHCDCCCMVYTEQEVEARIEESEMDMVY
ncbi:MAG: hypothetical protein GY696_16060 [Gammaproteobacteria bacterium]|nr:hypothetical protein [Gammaproteobacteria bacterium]